MRLKFLFVGENIGGIGAAPEREDMRVFKQQQLFAAARFAQLLDRAFLHSQPIRISRQSQPANFAKARAGSRGQWSEGWRLDLFCHAQYLSIRCETAELI